MNVANLRVEGDDEALNALVDRLELEVDRRKPAEMTREVRRFIEECKARHLSFSRPGISAEITVGVTVGDSTQYVAFVDLTASDLGAMGALGLNLSVTAYPTSDEANDAWES